MTMRDSERGKEVRREVLTCKARGFTFAQAVAESTIIELDQPVARDFWDELDRHALHSELRQIEELVAMLRLDPCELYAFELREHAGSVLHLIKKAAT